MTAWRTLTEHLKTSQTTDKIVLTDRLRTAPAERPLDASLTASPNCAASCGSAASWRRPSSEWAEYRAGTRTWANISWPLDSYRATSGTRAVACQTELQIVAGEHGLRRRSRPCRFLARLRLTYELTR